MQSEPNIISSAIKTELSANFALLLNVGPVNLSRKYGYVITLVSGQITNEIKYEVEVTYLKPVQPDKRLFKIDKISATYINGLEPDLLAEQLAYKAGLVFYPLTIETDLSGRFLNIYNYPEIFDRWQNKKNELQEYFEGEAAAKYIQLMNDVVASENQLNKVIRNDWFINLYFSGLYKSYTPAFTVSSALCFPVAGYAAPAKYATMQKVSEYLNDYKAIEIEHEGTLEDDRTIADFEMGIDFALSKIDNPELESATGFYKGLYVLEADTKIIESAIINVSLELTQTNNFNLKLFKIDESKAVNPTPPVLNATPQLLIIDGHADERGNKPGIFEKFMDSLFGK